MVIHINPNRINLPSSGSSKASERRKQLPSSKDDAFAKPARAAINHIPEPESLRTLIAGAIDAFKRGVTWDRGTILNLVV